jgi:hypothetical protein
MRRAQIWGDLAPGRRNFIRWPLIFVDPLYRTCFISPYWHPEVWVPSQIFFKLVDPSYLYTIVYLCLTISKCRPTYLSMLVILGKGQDPGYRTGQDRQVFLSERTPKGDYDYNGQTCYLIRFGHEPRGRGDDDSRQRRTDGLSVAEWLGFGLSSHMGNRNL